MSDIDGYNSVIESDDVRNRIEELENNRLFDVVRTRNGEVIQGDFDSEDDADTYIDEEDYNRERVSARKQELDEDDDQELRNLVRLVEDVGVSGDWTLYNANYFDSDWAQAQAIDTLDISRYKINDWPLDQIDWEEAASTLRDSRYEYSYEFDDTTFYGDE